MTGPQWTSWSELHRAVSQCEACPRLRSWCQAVGKEKVKRFAQESYWVKPVPGWGDVTAGLWVVGLAPAAHGANRTGRMFTGDRSGDWLYRAMFRAGFASQPTSVSRDDGLTLSGAYVSSVARCAPPQNKLQPGEIEACRPFLDAEWALLTQCRVIVCLGKLSFDQVWAMLKRHGIVAGNQKRPVFGHGVSVVLPNGVMLLGSYHPSQQNTFTGKLTEPMLDAIFTQARAHLTRS